MAQKKEDFLQRLIAGLSVRAILLHPATLFVMATMATIGGAIHLWNAHQNTIVDRDQFQLTVDNIRLTKQPEWCDTDLRKLVLENSSSDSNPSLLDTALVSRTVDAFRNVGWVEKVRGVAKSKQGLEIELVYRNAIGMVELNHLTIPNWPRNQTAKLMPVDRQGVIMPGKLVAEQSLIRFSIFNPCQKVDLETWSQWPDDRVIGAAAISESLQSHWQALGLYRIVTFRKPNESNDASIPYELWFEFVGTPQIIWGNPPGQEIAAEVSASEKLRALEEFVAKQGPLNRLPEQKIDVRSGKALIVGNAKSARLESLNLNRK